MLIAYISLEKQSGIFYSLEIGDSIKKIQGSRLVYIKSKAKQARTLSANFYCDSASYLNEKRTDWIYRLVGTGYDN